MKPSEHDGKRVLHVDGAGVQHSGYVVGQSDDGLTTFVQSDNPNVPDAAWHFAASSDLLPVLLKNGAL